ncbi:MAG TPA: tetratricopeptide repeat protein [Pyrinomonadaceae bacterium]|nr:tetratricopeptide repeat protein [Pyrinomonadaceae bacterium]
MRFPLSVVRANFHKPLLCILILLNVCIAVRAQVPGGVGSTRGLPESSGSSVIQGRVYFTEGRPADQRFRVTLEGNEDRKTTQTDQDGVFRFTGLKSGSYTVIVEGGKDYENAREAVFFEGGMRNTTVPIHLKSKADTAALARIPSPARDAYTKGMDAVAKGDGKKAVEFLSNAVKLYPDFPQALTELGRQYLLLNQMQRAAETYSALVKLKKEDASAHLNLGIALYNISLALQGEKKTDEANLRLAEAESALRQSLVLKMPGPNPHYYLGLTLIRIRKYDEAQKEMELTLANGGESLPLAHKYLGGLYISAKRNKDAADHLEKYLQLEPKAKDADQIKNTIKDLRTKS